MVLDELARAGIAAARESCDRDGRLAAAGRVDAVAAGRAAGRSGPAAPPPRSLGREQYGAEFCDALLAQPAPATEQDWCDLFATLTELTVQAVADRLPAARGARCVRWRWSWSAAAGPATPS